MKRYFLMLCLVLTSLAWTAQPLFAQPHKHWTLASWDDLPRQFDDPLQDAVPAWRASCARAQPAWRVACKELTVLQDTDAEVIRMWMHTRLQPYHVTSFEATGNTTQGLLTGYYEPIFKAARTPQGVYQYPLYRLPLVLEKNRMQTWLTREEIDKRNDLQNQAIAYLDDPMDVLALHIQGSGQLDLQGEDASAGRIRLAFAGTNNQPYKSVGAWLRETHGVRELSWPAIRAWAKNNPEHLNALLWSNPRVVFFKEELVPSANKNNAPTGPRGAAGVPLSAGRSIAIDPSSVPYGTPVWLASSGDSVNLSRLVIAQDTGAAIKGAVRADYFVGSGEAAGEIAGRLKQPLQMWVLWPK